METNDVRVGKVREFSHMTSVMDWVWGKGLPNSRLSINQIGGMRSVAIDQ